MDKSAIDDLNSVFKSGKIFDSSPEDLRRFLIGLGSIDPINQDPKTTHVVRALILNHIQMARTIDKLERTIVKLNEENGKLAFRVLVFTLVATGATLVQAVIAYLLFLRG